MYTWTVVKTNGKIMIIDKHSKKLIATCLSENDAIAICIYRNTFLANQNGEQFKKIKQEICNQLKEITFKIAGL